MSTVLHNENIALLAKLRAMRGFNAAAYRDAKAALINDYFRHSGLKAALVGVSGGVDSGVVTALLAYAMKKPGSQIARLVCASLPYYISEGTTNQVEATDRGAETASAFGAEYVVLDLSKTHKVLCAAGEKALSAKIEQPCRRRLPKKRAPATAENNSALVANAWAKGQLVSYQRTAAFYFLTALLTQQGTPALFVGTTNRDEGGYIGYFGKAADAMVDLQLISDLHKSEVYALARLLAVPHSVIEAIPAGDIHDGRTDEQLIGAPYDFIELYQLLLCLPKAEQQTHIASLAEAARAEFDLYAARLHQLNRENAHKYLGGSQSVHLDVYDRAVAGGWRLEVYPLPSETPAAPLPMGAKKLDTSAFNSYFTVAPQLTAALAPSAPALSRQDVGNLGDTGFIFKGLFSADEVATIMAELGQQPWTPVSLHGMTKGFDPATDPIGSWRATTFDAVLARRMWCRMAEKFPRLRFADKSGPTTDWDGSAVWRAVGVSPAMRFIKYKASGALVPHYDAPYVYHDGKRTLMSVVLYLTCNTPADGGATRFIVDAQAGMPLAQRNLNDWDVIANQPEQVLHRIDPSAGSALIFDHRLLHDSEALAAGVKVIMRTDIVFERCGLPKQAQVAVSRPLGMPEA